MRKSKSKRKRTFDVPEDLIRIRESFPEPKIREEFEKLYGRPPHSETEVEMWFEFYTIELYNNGYEVP